MRTSPTATVNRMTPAVTRRKSVTADRPDKQPPLQQPVGRDRLAGIEAVNQKRPLFVRPGRQGSRHQARERAERASLAAFRQTQRVGDEPGLQSKRRIERPPRDIESGENRLAQEAGRKRPQRCKPESRSSWRQQAQTHPCGARHGREPNWKISRRPARDHQPKDEEQRDPPGRRPRHAGGGAIRRGAQDADPTREAGAMRDPA